MSRVHDALRRAEQAGTIITPPPAGTDPGPGNATTVVVTEAPPRTSSSAGTVTSRVLVGNPLEGLLSRIEEIPFNPAPESHLIDVNKPHEPPAEEFRTLRTRLNHIQTLQPVSTLVVTSPSPAEGKSFAAVNLALTEAQLSGNQTLLIDCDFRRPIVHTLFQVNRTPGMTDYLQGKAPIEDCIKKVQGLDLCIMPAGESVINPLELLNLHEMKMLLDRLPAVFKWVVIDSPPLLFAADANLLGTLCTASGLRPSTR
jgi:protein-tyrosine kinase